MATNKITPALWFQTDEGKMIHVSAYYKGIFNDNIEIGDTMVLGETPSGHTEMCHIKLFSQPYMIMSTEKEHHQFNDSFALIIHCENQQEIDKYWHYFTQEGKESMCGWCIDKFGLRWQVMPKHLGELMKLPNANMVMMKQTKIIIADYLQ